MRVRSDCSVDRGRSDELALSCVLSLNAPKMSKEQLTAVGHLVGRDFTAMGVSATSVQQWAS